MEQDDSVNERAQLAGLCRKFGANDVQADVMAGQLLKRAAQIAGEKGVSREEALEYLLQVMIHGRRGDVFKGRAPLKDENTG